MVIVVSSAPVMTGAEKGESVGLLLTAVREIDEVTPGLVAGALVSRSVTCQLTVRLEALTVGSLLVEL